MAKKFKVHNMYSKTGIKKVAKTMSDHLSLKKEVIITIKEEQIKNNG